MGCQAVGGLEVLGIARGANPAEGTEAVVKEHRAHDVLNIGRIAELAVGRHDVGTSAARLQQEGVAIVKEVHALVGQLVDGGTLAAQRCTHTLLELLRLLGHHALALLEGQAHGIVATGPGVVQRRLVTTQVYMHILVGQAFPQINDIAHIGHRDGPLVGHSLADSGNQLVKIVVQFVDPTLVIALLCGQRVDLGGYADHASDVTGLGLSARHAT